MCRSQIWNKDLYASLMKNYKNLYYHHIFLRDQVSRNSGIQESIDEFFKFENINSEGGAYLFLALKTFALDDHMSFFEAIKFYHSYDLDIEYPQEILDIWVESNCANTLWYWLVNEGGISNKTFELNNLIDVDRQEILILINKINSSKYKGKKLNRELLGELGTDFDQFYLPNLRELTFLNKLPFPFTLRFILNILLIIILTGVLIPLFLSSVRLFDTIGYIILCNLCVFGVAFSLFVFLLFFKRILDREISF